VVWEGVQLSSQKGAIEWCAVLLDFEKNGEVACHIVGCSSRLVVDKWKQVASQFGQSFEEIDLLRLDGCVPGFSSFTRGESTKCRQSACLLWVGVWVCVDDVKVQ
jgi:hypothetical protein